MELLLLKYGYLLLFLGIFIEGEAFLLAGSFLSNRGYFDLSSVILIALAANTLGSQFYYMAARPVGGVGLKLALAKACGTGVFSAGYRGMGIG